VRKEIEMPSHSCLCCYSVTPLLTMPFGDMLTCAAAMMPVTGGYGTFVFKLLHKAKLPRG
jgi:hypothetical protein